MRSQIGVAVCCNDFKKTPARAFVADDLNAVESEGRFDDAVAFDYFLHTLRDEEGSNLLAEWHLNRTGWRKETANWLDAQVDFSYSE